MNFQDALTALKEGKKIRRPQWYIEASLILKGKKIGYLICGKFKAMTADVNYYLCSGDLLAEDWETAN